MRWVKACGLVCGLLLVVALCAPTAKVGAQSGRKREEPSPTPRKSTQQRPRRTAPTSTTETTPARSSSSGNNSSKQESPSSVNLPMADAPPPLATPTPTPAPASNAPASSGSAQTQEGEEVDAADVVRINSNLVTIPASVVDDRGRAVIDLKLEDFELRVDGQPKDISELGRAETPVRLVMLFDNSMSLAAAREFEKKAAVKFFRTVLRPIDTAAVYSIWTVPILAQPFTNDVRTLVRTIESFGNPEDGATALFDTVAQAAEYLRPYQGRKSIVIVSDGADTLSNMDFLTSLKRVITADVQVYAVQTGQLESANLYNLSAHHRLQEYTSQTGGAVYVPQVTSDLDTAFAQSSADLAQQYVLSYYPQDDRNDGRFRTISLRIKTRPNMRVRARKGYYDRTGQRQALAPVENVNVVSNQPETTRPEPVSGAGQSSMSPAIERRDFSPTTTGTSSGTRRTSAGGYTVGPPGPDDDTPRPERVESARNINQPQPPFSSSGNASPSSPSSSSSSSIASPSSSSLTPAPQPAQTPSPSTAPAPNKTTARDEKPAPKRPLSGGVLNGKALSLPKPLYPPTAKNSGVTGTVIIEVLIDEGGKVISARAISGPQMLQAVAVQAARQAKFSPTKLSGEPVQVLGTITYSFVRP
jgi:VWFA-related protein/TonB family protein